MWEEIIFYTFFLAPVRKHANIQNYKQILRLRGSLWGYDPMVVGDPIIVVEGSNGCG